MISLILGIILGGIIVYIAMQNTSLITFRVGNYIWSIPVYLLAIGSLLLGMFLSFIASLDEWISSSFALRGKEDELSTLQNHLRDEDKRTHEFEEQNMKLIRENEKLRGVSRGSHSPGFFDRLRQRIST